MKRLIVPIIGALALVQAQATPLIVFNNNFNGALPSEISGVGFLASVEGYAGVGAFSGNYLRNSSGAGSAIVLSLSGLPAHDSVDLDFLLAVIDSWDGDSGGCCNPDHFNVRVDGTTVLTAGYTIFGGNAESPAGSLLIDSSHRAVNASWNDEAYDMSSVAALALAHSASTLTVEFFPDGAGWQAGDDESFAIENLTVTINATGPSVPDGGSTAGLLALGVAALAAFNRKRA